MGAKKQSFVSFASSSQLMPQEEVLEVKKNRSNLTIGVPKEISFQENRVGLVPEAVNLLVQNGHRVVVESDAGKSAHFYNTEYSESGAEIVATAAEVYKSDIIIKIAPLSAAEIDLLKTKQTIISALHLTIQDQAYFRKLMAKKTTMLAFEHIKDKTKIYPVVKAMSEIAGNTAVLIAAEYLSHAEFGKGCMLGGFSGITPTEVVILGAGTVGEYSARAAMGLGAMVKVFDNSIYKLRRLQNNLNTRIFTSIIQPKVLLKSLLNADVVIGAIHSAEGRTPCVVSEEMVSQMKQGSILIDVSIDQGGCFETSHGTTHANPVFSVNGITHYCVPNIPSKVPHTASFALSNFFTPILLNIGEVGGVQNIVCNDIGLRNGVYIYNGVLTNQFISKQFDIPAQDIDLLTSTF